MKAQLLKSRRVLWLLAAVLAAVATLGLASAPASAQDTPQWPVNVDGTNYGNVFDRKLASSEALHLISLEAAIKGCNKLDYDYASALLWSDYLFAKARYEKFQQQRTFNKKLRSGVWGGQDVFARQDARLKHDVDEALKIYNGRPPYPCVDTPTQPTTGGGTPIPPVTPPPVTSPEIAKAQRIADNAQKVLDGFSGCIPPDLANSWISLLFNQELEVIKFSKAKKTKAEANRSLIENDALIQRLDKLLKEFDRRKCVPETTTPDAGGTRSVGGGFFERTPGFVKSYIALDGGGTHVHYKFEDDFDSRHTAAILGVRAGLDWHLGGNWSVGPMSGIYVPIGRAEKQGLETGINWFGTAEVKVATPITHDIRIWGSGGFAFGEIANRTATLNQSVVATGWTGAAGVNYEFQPTWNVGLTYRYLHLGPKFVDGLRTGVNADSSQLFISLQKNFMPR